MDEEEGILGGFAFAEDEEDSPPSPPPTPTPPPSDDADDDAVPSILPLDIAPPPPDDISSNTTTFDWPKYSPSITNPPRLIALLSSSTPPSKRQTPEKLVCPTCRPAAFRKHCASFFQSPFSKVVKTYFRNGAF